MSDGEDEPPFMPSAPSDFNIFKDSLKETLNNIYAETRLNLPSVKMDDTDVRAAWPAAHPLSMVDRDFCRTMTRRRRRSFSAGMRLSTLPERSLCFDSSQPGRAREHCP